MISFRPIDLERDYATLQSWWKGHNAHEVPRVILPMGLIASGGDIEIAAGFLYQQPKMIGVIEWVTTNPKCAYSRDLVAAVRGIFLALEQRAKDDGCLAVISFVKPAGSEERILSKIGYIASSDDSGHRLLMKPLVASEYKAPVGGVETCQR